MKWVFGQAFCEASLPKAPGSIPMGCVCPFFPRSVWVKPTPPQKKKNNLVEPEKFFFLLRVWVGFPANACKELNLLPPKKFFPPVSAFKTLAKLHKKKKTFLAPKSCFGIKSLEGFLSCGRGGLQNPLLSPKFFWTRLSPSKTKGIPISARLPHSLCCWLHRTVPVRASITLLYFN